MANPRSVAAGPLDSPASIYWAGPVYDRGGYGNVSRNCLLGLARSGFPVKVFCFGPDHRKDLSPLVVERMESLQNARIGRDATAVIHATPDLFTKIKLKGVSRRIGYTIFETDRIPSQWVKHCNRMDEVWVPSGFNRRTFAESGVDPARIKIVPYGIDTDFFRPTGGTFPIPGKKSFCFLYVFLFDWRKGFDLVLEAFFKEFTSRDDVSLVLKVYNNPSERRDVRGLILRSVRDRVNLERSDLAHLVILDQPLAQEELKRLYNTCDLYISTDRANGWGMPCMEAMAMGKAAATIDWSGSTEFMKEENSFLIKPTGNLVPVDPNLSAERPQYYAGHHWAEVRTEEVRRVMRLAYARRDLLEKMAARGREDILNRFSLEIAARHILEAVAAGALPWHKKLYRRLAWR